MKNKYIFFISLLISSFTMTSFAQYKADMLGSGFEPHTIQLDDDYEGEVRATLIRSLANNKSQTAVLYIHGYNDYFFQEHLAKEITDAGFHFYALDLRKYGRSHLAHQKWCNVREISEYYPEIDSAINIMEDEGIERIFLNPHSTGGLIIANYLNDRKEDKRITASLFNSPFLEFNYGCLAKKIGVPMYASTGKKDPDKEVKSGLDVNYGKSIYIGEKGQWDYKLVWKSHQSHPVNYGWIRAIYLAQKRLKKESDIQIPIVVFSSDKSYKKKQWDDAILISDAVLNVKDIWKFGKRLGNNVSLEIITDGTHDLSLSIEPARKLYFEKLIEWIKKLENPNNLEK